MLNKSMFQLFKDYQIDSSFERLDFQTIHKWLASTYWSPDIAMEKVLRAAKNSSMVVGVYLNEVQVGYMRVVSDKSSFAYIGDVFVAEEHRGKGIAKAKCPGCSKSMGNKPLYALAEEEKKDAGSTAGE